MIFPRRRVPGRDPGYGRRVFVQVRVEAVCDGAVPELLVVPPRGDLGDRFGAGSVWL